jgi:hypothetical protein
MSNIIDPVSGAPFGRIIGAGGATVQAQIRYLVECQTPDGAVTVDAPLSAGLPEGSCFAVEDTGADASTNNITINGNGTNIDGAATLVLSDDAALCVLVLDDGEWRQTEPQRVVPGRAQANPWTRAAEESGGGGGGPIALAGDVTGTTAASVVDAIQGVVITGVAGAGDVLTATAANAAEWQAPGGGGDALPNLLLSIAQGAKACGTVTAANETHGYRFINYAPMTVSGVRIFTGSAGIGKTFKCQLWDLAGSAIATASHVGVANNAIVDVLFAAPVAIPAITTSGTFHMVSVWAGAYSVFLNAAPGTVWPPVAAWPFSIARDVLFKVFSWAGPDAWPGTAITSELYAFEPIMVRT